MLELTVWTARRSGSWVFVSMVVVLALIACGGSPRRSAPPVATPGSAAAADGLCESGRDLFVRGDFAGAAERFDRCSQADPTRAEAYYRAGLAYYEIGRTALMVDRFETFVKLAPDAPERPQVESILNTMRR